MENETCPKCGAKLIFEINGTVHFSCGTHSVGVSAYCSTKCYERQLALYKAVAEAAGEAIRLCGLEGSLDRLDAALADLPGGEG